MITGKPTFYHALSFYSSVVLISFFLLIGANSGLGRVTAQLVAKRNAKVLIVCRNEGAGIIARDEIINATQNENVILHLADISLPTTIKSLVNELEIQGQIVDVLVSCIVGYLLGV